MSNIGDIERITQNRIVKLFQGKELGYKYLGNWTDRENNSNIEEDLLRKYLQKRGYNQNLIKKTLFQLNNTASNLAKGLYSANKEVYSMLRYGVKVKAEIGEHTQTVELIDWKNIKNNNFYIAEEVTINGQLNKRPDIVIYVNGIALAVIELKRSTVSVAEGIRQSIGNQNFIRQFFTTIQIITAGNDSEGLKYGTVETIDKFYLSWKEDLKSENAVFTDVVNLLDKQILQMFSQERFLEFINDFIVFDAGKKKLCRPNQYFGVKAAQKNINRKQGGIIWHTQGSGKSLTMVWLAKWIKEFNSNGRILVITDREELDEQIERVFNDVDENIRRTTSGKDLLDVLNTRESTIICSLIHKFGRKTEAEDKDYEEYIKEIEANLPKDFYAKGDIYVFVDECHRTQSGKLHRAMKKILPENAIFIGFTGTPLLKTDKETSLEIFGGYIHTYKFNEAVKDKVILDLRYEARDVNQFITAQDKIDTWFEAKTRGLTENAKTELKKKWGTMQKVLSSRSRLEKIVADIRMDMETKSRLMDDTGTAILVAGSIYEACKYYELFRKSGLKKCAIITSYAPSKNDIKLEDTGEDTETERAEKYSTYMEMLDGQDIEAFEKEAKRKFIEEPAQMKLLIVVDKLLTGFDAPSATYLYIDKNMQDHGLFQAICRVNRLDGESKDYGYIIDYKDLFKSLESAVNDYTTEVFANYDKEDITGLLKNRIEKAREDLDNALDRIKLLCEGVQEPKDEEAYYEYFAGDNREAIENVRKRTDLYKYTSALIRAYVAIADHLEEAGYSLKEIEAIKKDVKFYEQLRLAIKMRSCDYIDLKSYEPDMRYLIDTYIDAEQSKIISNFDDMTLIELIVQRGESAIDSLPEGIKKNQKAVAETIENNIRKVVNSEYLTNPKYYEKMSALLDEIIKARKEGADNYKAYLSRIIELAKIVQNRSNKSDYPVEIKTRALQALYDNLGQNKELALNLHNAIITNKQDKWRENKFKRKEVENIIKKFIKTAEEQKRIFELVENQNEY